MRYVRRPQARMACAFYILFISLSPNMSHVIVIVHVAHASSSASIVSPPSTQSRNRDLHFCRDNRRSLRRLLRYAQYMGEYVFHATTSRRIYASCNAQCSDDRDVVCHATSDHIGMTLLL